MMLIGNKTRLNPRSPNRPSKTRRGAADLGFSPRLISNKIVWLINVLSISSAFHNNVSWWASSVLSNYFDICTNIYITKIHTELFLWKSQVVHAGLQCLSPAQPRDHNSCPVSPKATLSQIQTQDQSQTSLADSRTSRPMLRINMRLRMNSR